MSLCILLQIYCTKSPTYKVQFQEHIHKFSLLIKSELAKVPNDKISYIVLYCNRFIILFIQIMHKKTKKTFLILQYSTLKSAVRQLAHRGWHQGNRQEESLYLLLSP